MARDCFTDAQWRAVGHRRPDRAGRLGLRRQLHPSARTRRHLFAQDRGCRSPAARPGLVLRRRPLGPPRPGRLHRPGQLRAALPAPPRAATPTAGGASVPTGRGRTEPRRADARCRRPAVELGIAKARRTARRTTRRRRPVLVRRGRRALVRDGFLPSAAGAPATWVPCGAAGRLGAPRPRAARRHRGAAAVAQSLRRRTRCTAWSAPFAARGWRGRGSAGCSAQVGLVDLAPDGSARRAASSSVSAAKRWK